MPLRVTIRAPGTGPADGSPPPSLSFDVTRVVIGRSDGCDVRLPDPSVSSRHATFKRHGGSWLVADEGSTNGTFLGGVRLSPQAPRVLAEGDLVRVGRVWLEVSLDAAAQVSSPQETKELALLLVQRAIASMGEDVTPRLVGEEGPDAGKTIPLGPPGSSVVLGRGTGSDVLLDEPDASRKHVQITRRGDGYLVRDLGSKNGTVLGDTAVPTGRDVSLRPGDRLRIGTDVFRYENPAATALSELERAADEAMKTDEVVPPPVDPSAAEPVHPEAPDMAGASAPVVSPPAPQTRAVAKRQPGWGASDVLIVLVALGVLAVSIGGLWLLLKP
jgi:pSer/pThr/pTyr-binding forkhead associated (FHA) protein